MIEYENLGLLNQPYFEQFRKSFDDTLRGGWYILGKNVNKFEHKFALYCGSKHCIGLASGLDALFLSLRALGLKPEDEVIVPSNTYIATILSIIQNGQKPVLVEPDITTYNINPGKIEEKITSRTKTIMVVHLYGKCCEMNPIIELCRKYHLSLIEDCAQAHGATYKGKKSGSFGAFGAFSFYPTKNLGALGDAGAVITTNSEYCDTLLKLRNYGSSVKYVNDIAGFNSRLDELQAGFLLIKLKYLDKINEHKRQLASIYLNNLKKDFILPVVHPDYYDVYHIFNIRHPKRDDLKTFLLKNEIKTEIHYPIPPHRQKAMKDYFAGGEYPVADMIHNTTLSLPVSSIHSDDDILKVVEVLNKF